MSKYTQYPVREDGRGSFQELIKSSDVQFGQLSILTVNPRQTRGGHYHKRKLEWFCCIRGECSLALLDCRSRQVGGIILTELDRKFWLVSPYLVHTIFNPSSEICELLVISSEIYDPDDEDTYRTSEEAK